MRFKPAGLVCMIFSYSFCVLMPYNPQENGWFKDSHSSFSIGRKQLIWADRLEIQVSIVLGFFCLVGVFFVVLGFLGFFCLCLFCFVFQTELVKHFVTELMQNMQAEEHWSYSQVWTGTLTWRSTVSENQANQATSVDRGVRTVPLKLASAGLHYAY